MKKHFKVTASKNANKKSIKASNSNKKGMKNMRNINASANGSYNYMEAMVDDIKDYLDENLSDYDYEDREDLEEKLNDDLWTEDSVTGNGSGFYDYDSYEHIQGDPNAMDYIRDLVSEFGIEAETVAEKFLNEEYDYWDISIRCYLLGQAIGEALDQLGIE